MNKLLRINEFLNVSKKDLKKYGVYNGYVNIDSELYINPKLLIDCNIPEFENSYNKINDYFESIIIQLKKCKSTSANDLMWRLALKMFCFQEPNGVALGNSNLSINGNGLNGKTASDALIKLKEMIDNNIDDPQIFGMLAIVQDNIGVDRISDMISNIIYEDLLTYTENVLKKLNIKSLKKIKYNGKNYNIKSRENGANLILVPEMILSDIPPFIDCSSIQAIINENVEIKQQIYEMFYEANTKLKKKSVSQVNVKDLNKNQLYEVIKDCNLYEQIIEENSKIEPTPYDFEKDENGIHKPIEKIRRIINFKDFNSLETSQKLKNESFPDFIENAINQLKSIIEKKGLNQELYRKVKSKDGFIVCKAKGEDTIHRFFIAVVETLKQFYDFDYVFEPMVGNGRVDFRFCKNEEIILVEFKLNTNKLKDGYDNQLTEYMNRENSKNAFYVIVKIKDNEAVENFFENTTIRNDRKVIVIDGLPKLSPSHIHK